MKKKHEDVVPLKKDGFFYIKMDTLKYVGWPGVALGQFKMMDGLKILSKDLAKEVRKLGYDCLAVFWPNGKSDSFVEVTNRITFAFVPKGLSVKVCPWDPWDAATGDYPNLAFDIYTKVIEIHRFEQMEYFGAFWRLGLTPMEFVRDITKYDPCIINPVKEKVYFRKNKMIVKFLES